MKRIVERRLLLRAVTGRDAPILAKWFNHQDNVRFMSPIIRGRKHTLRGIRKEIKSMDREYERSFMVVEKKMKKTIGYAGIDDIFQLDKRGEIYFIIGDKSEQGKGYGKEIVALLLEYAFHKLRLHSVSASAVVENKASLAILAKFGFKRIGVRRDYNNIQGKYVDEMLFDLLDREYFRKRNV